MHTEAATDANLTRLHNAYAADDTTGSSSSNSIALCFLRIVSCPCIGRC